MLRRRKVIIAGCAVLFCVFLTVIALASYPAYEARGTVQFASAGGGLSLMGEFFALSGTSQINSEIQIIRSRGIAEAIIDECDLRLGIDDVTYGGPLSRAIMFVLADRLERRLRGLRIDQAEFPEESVDKKFFLTFTDDSGCFTLTGPDGELGTGRQDQRFESENLSFMASMLKGPAGTRFRLSPRDSFVALEGFLDGLDVSPLGGATRTNLIEVTYRDSEPTLASDVVNAVIEEYERRDLDWKTQQGSDQIRHIEQRLAEALGELEEAETALEEYKNVHGVVTLPEEASLAVTDLSRRETQRIDVNLRLSMLQEIHTGLERDLDTDEFAVPPSLLGDAVIQELAADHARLTLQCTDLLLDYTESHPAVISKREAIRGVRESILETLAATVSGLVEQRDNLASVIGQLETELYGIPGIQRELLDLTRSLSIADEAFRLLARRHEEARLIEVSLTTGHRIVDLAVPPARPVAPSIKMNLMLGLGLGLIFGLLAAFLLEVLDTRIRSPEETESLLGAVPIAVVGHGGPDEISQAASTLALAAMHSENQALALLWPGPESDKSRQFIESIIAELSISVQPILVIDASTMKRESGFFGAANSPGLSEIVRGIDAGPQSVLEGRVKVLPAGDDPRGGHVSSPLVRKRVTELRKGAVLTVINAPDLTSEPAARGWAALAGDAVLVLVRNRDLRDNVIDAVEALGAYKVPVLGALLLE